MSTSAGLQAFSDPLGPKGRLRTRIASAAGLVLILGLLVIALRRLDSQGQLDQQDWEQILSKDGFELLLGGLVQTLKVAVIAVALSLSVGTLMALGRLSRIPFLRYLAGTYVELFRALPSLLLILIMFFGIGLGQFAAIVVGLSLYNSAVMAEIVRAGILSLPRGQAEAALAVGMTTGQVSRFVVLPQAISRMLPSIVAQGVVVLKDTSYGFVIGFEELLRRGQIAGQVTGDLLQCLVVVAVMYIAVCLSLSQVARWLEGRQRRRYGRAPVLVGNDAGAPAAA
ncbi:MAG: amino acid ABC transporter permease [Mycobacteriales bacterium]|nr:amino acid ABC transporter permease [Mycobacteriales bacterium]